MEIQEIKSSVDALGSAWEEFKKTNDARLKEIETKGAADPLLEEKLSKLSAAMDEQKAKADKLEAALSRPGATAEEKADKEAGEYKAAFIAYAKKGLEEKALSVNSDPDGGYLVTPAMSATIVKKVFETSPMRQLASIETISTDSLELIVDNGDNTSGWVGEESTRSDTTTPTIGKKTIVVHELYTQPKATQKLLDDAAVNVEAWLAGKVADEFGRKEATAFISGTGVAQPRGILTYTAGTSWGQIEQVVSGSNGAVTADGLITLLYTLKEPYMLNASFIANRTTVAAMRKLKGSDNNYLWQPGLQAGAPDVLLGKPVLMATDMPVAASNSLSVAVADFRQAYQIVDRIGIRTLRDPYTDKPFVKFYTTKRVGGDVTNFEAIKLLKLVAS